MDLQDAETPTEINLLLRGDVLIAKHHDVVVQVRLMDTGEVRIAERPGQIQSGDFRTHFFGEGADVECLIG